MRCTVYAPPAGLQVTKEATTHLAFHPTIDTLIVACAGEGPATQCRLASLDRARCPTELCLLHRGCSMAQHTPCQSLFSSLTGRSPGALPPADKRGNVGLWHVNEGSYELPAAARRAAPILRRPEAKEGQEEEGEGEEPEAEGSGHAKPGGGWVASQAGCTAVGWRQDGVAWLGRVESPSSAHAPSLPFCLALQPPQARLCLWMPLAARALPPPPPPPAAAAAQQQLLLQAKSSSTACSACCRSTTSMSAA